MDNYVLYTKIGFFENGFSGLFNNGIMTIICLIFLIALIVSSCVFLLFKTKKLKSYFKNKFLIKVCASICIGVCVLASAGFICSGIFNNGVVGINNQVNAYIDKDTGKINVDALAITNNSDSPFDISKITLIQSDELSDVNTENLSVCLSNKDNNITFSGEGSNGLQNSTINSNSQEQFDIEITGIDKKDADRLAGNKVYDIAIETNYKVVDFPEIQNNLVYNGYLQSPINSCDAYSLSGQYSEKSVGNYCFSIKLNDGYIWRDGTRSNIENIQWCIDKKCIELNEDLDTSLVVSTKCISSDQIANLVIDNGVREQVEISFVVSNESQNSTTYSFELIGSDAGNYYIDIKTQEYLNNLLSYSGPVVNLSYQMLDNPIYTGNEVDAPLVITDRSRSNPDGTPYILKKNEDYKFNLGGTKINHNSESDYYLEIEGMGSYYGTVFRQDLHWNIDPRDLNWDDFSYSMGQFPVYNGRTQMAPLSIRNNLCGADLRFDFDYTLSDGGYLKDVVNLGSFATVHGKGNYKGDMLLEREDLLWNILPKTVSLSWKNIVNQYDGYNHQVYAEVKDTAQYDKNKVVVTKYTTPANQTSFDVKNVGEYWIYAYDLMYEGDDVVCPNYVLPSQNYIQFKIEPKPVFLDWDKEVSKIYDGQEFLPKAKISGACEVYGEIELIEVDQYSISPKDEDSHLTSGKAIDFGNYFATANGIKYSNSGLVTSNYIYDTATINTNDFNIEKFNVTFEWEDLNKTTDTGYYYTGTNLAANVITKASAAVPYESIIIDTQISNYETGEITSLVINQGIYYWEGIGISAGNLETDIRNYAFNPADFPKHRVIVTPAILSISNWDENDFVYDPSDSYFVHPNAYVDQSKVYPGDGVVDVIQYKVYDSSGQHITEAPLKVGKNYKVAAVQLSNQNYTLLESDPKIYTQYDINKAQQEFYFANVDIPLQFIYKDEGGDGYKNYLEYTYIGESKENLKFESNNEDLTIAKNSASSYGIICTSKKANIQGTISVSSEPTDNYEGLNKSYDFYVTTGDAFDAYVYVEETEFINAPGSWMPISNSIFIKKFYSGTPYKVIEDEWISSGFSVSGKYDFSGKFEASIEGDVLTGNTSFKAVLYPWLDTYSLHDLLQFSTDISKNHNESPYYDQFMFYAQNDEIWWSQSNGYFREKGYNYKSIVNSKDVEYCNQLYKCSFVEDSAESLNPNNFIFLRIIGVDHDYYKRKNESNEYVYDKLGLTFQPIHSLPLAAEYGSENTSWWGADGSVRQRLYEGGDIFSRLSKAFKLSMATTYKFSQSGSLVSSTTDGMFLPSFSELYAKNSGASVKDWEKNGLNETGEQIFDPNNPATEGYCYEWNYFHQIDAATNNDLLGYLDLCNNGDPTHYSSNANTGTWQRSYYDASNNTKRVVNENGNISKNYYTNNTLQGIVPCFSLADLENKNACVIFGDDAYITDVDKNKIESRGWAYNEDKKGYQKQFQVTTSYEQILQQWSDITIQKETEFFNKFNPSSGYLLEDTDFSIDWEDGSKATVCLNNISVSESTVPDGWIKLPPTVDGEPVKYWKIFKQNTPNADILAEWNSTDIQCTTYHYDFDHFNPNTGLISEGGQEYNPINHPWLDTLTLEQIIEDSNKVSKNEEGWEAIAEQYDFYERSKQVWWSQTNGAFRDAGKDIDSPIGKNEVLLCNQNYKCSFAIDDATNPNPNNFLFLRIVGINHDYKHMSGSDDVYVQRCGFTFQTIHALPSAYSMSNTFNEDLWWGSEYNELRNALQQGGAIYEKLNPIFKNNIISTKKFSYDNKNNKISETVDKMFLPSYSEIYSSLKDPSLTPNWYNNGWEEPDGQRFDPKNPQTEEYVYELSRYADIKGYGYNVDLASLVRCNTGEFPYNLTCNSSWLRSVQFNDSESLMCISANGNVALSEMQNKYLAVQPCFCLGEQPNFDFSLNLNGGSIKEGSSIPKGWYYDSVNYCYKKDGGIKGGTSFKDILSVWKDILSYEHHWFVGFENYDAYLIKDSSVSVLWQQYYVATLDFTRSISHPGGLPEGWSKVDGQTFTKSFAEGTPIVALLAEWDGKFSHKWDIFDGWEYDTSLTTLNKDMTFSAKWISTYRVTVDLTGTNARSEKKLFPAEKGWYPTTSLSFKYWKMFNENTSYSDIYSDWIGFEIYKEDPTSGARLYLCGFKDKSGQTEGVITGDIELEGVYQPAITATVKLNIKGMILDDIERDLPGWKQNPDGESWSNNNIRAGLSYLEVLKPWFNVFMHKGNAEASIYYDVAKFDKEDGIFDSDTEFLGTCYQWLDYYTLEDLAYISNDIRVNKETSTYYDQFYYYTTDVRHDNVWWSNSNGWFRLHGKNLHSVISNEDVINCNQNYKNNFDYSIYGYEGGFVEDCNQFIFLRIIGINHDYASKGTSENDRNGLTFQTVHALPIALAMGDGVDQWWGNVRSVRPYGQLRGPLYSQFNKNITDLIIGTEKFTQDERIFDSSIQKTEDKIFIPSYSEVWAQNNLFPNYSWFGNGRDEFGRQTFQLSNPQTEGYCYEWYLTHKFDGAQSNEFINSLSECNDATKPLGEDTYSSWLRSVYPVYNEAFVKLDSSGNPFQWIAFDEFRSIVPCFCLGPRYDVEVNLGDGDLAPGKLAPEGWVQKSEQEADKKTYVKSFQEGTSYDDIVYEWNNSEIWLSNSYVKSWKSTGGNSDRVIRNDTKFVAEWANGYQVSVDLSNDNLNPSAIKGPIGWVQNQSNGRCFEKIVPAGTRLDDVMKEWDSVYLTVPNYYFKYFIYDSSTVINGNVNVNAYWERGCVATVDLTIGYVGSESTVPDGWTYNDIYKVYKKAFSPNTSYKDILNEWAGVSLRADTSVDFSGWDKTDGLLTEHTIFTAEWRGVPKFLVLVDLRHGELADDQVIPAGWEKYYYGNYYAKFCNEGMMISEIMKDWESIKFKSIGDYQFVGWDYNDTVLRQYTEIRSLWTPQYTATVDLNKGKLDYGQKIPDGWVQVEGTNTYTKGFVPFTKNSDILEEWRNVKIVPIDPTEEIFLYGITNSEGLFKNSTTFQLIWKDYLKTTINLTEGDVKDSQIPSGWHRRGNLNKFEKYYPGNTSYESIEKEWNNVIIDTKGNYIFNSWDKPSGYLVEDTEISAQWNIGYEAKVDLTSGNVLDESQVPQNWVLVEGTSNVYKKNFSINTDYQEIYNEWKYVKYKSPFSDYYMSGFDKVEGKLIENTVFYAQWNLKMYTAQIVLNNSTCDVTSIPKGWRAVTPDSYVFIKSFPMNMHYEDIFAEWSNVTITAKPHYDFAWFCDPFEKRTGMLTSDTIFHDACCPWLDTLSLEELRRASEDISWYGEDSLFYDQFLYYMETDQVWWSYSYGWFRDNGKQADSVITSSDVKNHCNYRCNFVADTIENPNPNNYLFLRVVGVNHDYVENGIATRCGVTFQPIHSLPYADIMSEDEDSWWDFGTTVRESLQDGGSLYEGLNYDYKTKIIKAAKFSQDSRTKTSSIRKSSDKLFLPSYSEMFTYGAVGNSTDWYKSGLNDQGEQIFDPFNPKTEGYTYGWYKQQAFNSDKANLLLAGLSKCNDGSVALGSSKNGIWTRSIYNGNSKYLSVNSLGRIDFNNCSSSCSLAPCFCLGNTDNTYNSIVIDLGDGSIEPEDVPEGWHYEENLNLYYKTYREGEDIENIIGEWDTSKINISKDKLFVKFASDTHSLKGGIHDDIYVYASYSPSLDTLTIDDISYASADIANNGEESEYYDQFMVYAKTNQIWWSNSDGWFNERNYDESTPIEYIDVLHCNQKYKCSFVQDTSSRPDPDNFIFLKVLGVNHDYVSESSDKRVGVTLQTIHALPQAFQFVQPTEGNDETSWEKSSLRKSLNDDVYKKGLNEYFKEKLIQVYKYSEQSREGANISGIYDNLFVPSYSESYKAQGEASYFDIQNYKYFNNGRDADGKQIFDPIYNRVTEGYCYEWSWYNNIIDTKDQVVEKLANSIYTNSKKLPTPNSQIVSLRSVFPDEDSSDFANLDLNKGFSHADQQEYFGVCPCFCVADYSPRYTATVNFTDGSVDESKIPEGWYKFGGTNLYQKSFDVCKEYSEILSEWNSPTDLLVPPNNCDFGGFDKEEGILTCDTEFSAKWYPWLDCYDINQLNVFAIDIQENGQDSPYYDQFMYYATDTKHDHIWWSNSNGWFRNNNKTASSKITDNDVINCNQDYKCSFVNTDGSLVANADQFVFLRVIGVNHDYVDGSNSRSGITFQTVHALNVPSLLYSDYGDWWGTSFIREIMNDGYVYNQFNGKIKELISPVNKFTQDWTTDKTNIQLTDDKLFIPSYSESYYKNKNSNLEDEWMDNGLFADGSQNFDPYAPKTEGYCYEWYKTHDIDGTAVNNALKDMNRFNSGDACSVYRPVYERSYYGSNGIKNFPSSYVFLNQGAYGETEYDKEIDSSYIWSVAPCFSFGSVKKDQRYTVTVDLTRGRLEDGEKQPDGWVRGENEGIYYKNYDYGTSFEDIQKEWDSCSLIGDELCFNGFDIESGSLYRDVTFKALWSKGYKVSVKLNNYIFAPYSKPPAGWHKVKEENTYTKYFSANIDYKEISNQWNDIVFYDNDNLKYDCVGIDYKDGTLSKDQEFNVKVYKWLDVLTLQEISYASDSIGRYKEKSPYYEQFVYYLATNQIWWSNSGGYFRENGFNEDSAITSQDVYERCKYKCNFVEDNEYAPSPNNYLFLRVIGLNHDHSETISACASGITLQPIHALPYSQPFNDTCKKWEDSDLRKSLNSDDGLFYSRLNDAYKENLVPVLKYNNENSSYATNIKTTEDKLFLLSASEMYCRDNQFSWSWKQCGWNSKGEVIFDPDKPKTEGYCYEWNWFNSISGSSTNPMIQSIYKCNDGEQPSLGFSKKTWTRSFSENSGMIENIDRYGRINNDDLANVSCSILPAFCIGEIEPLTATIDLTRGDIATNCNIPDGWRKIADSNVYQKEFYCGTKVSDIYAEWQSTSLVAREHYDFEGFDCDDEYLYNNTIINAKWMLWLDALTLNDLNAISLDIGEKGMDSQYYDLVMHYINSNQIWWSNSNGWFREQGKNEASQITNYDVAHCNQVYKNAFTNNNGVLYGDPDQFIFFKIIGINHDYSSTHDIYGDRQGLTVQCIHALPAGHEISSSDATYHSWSTSQLRDWLNISIYNQLCPDFQHYIGNTRKYSLVDDGQKPLSYNIESSVDRIFVQSYSEMYNNNKASTLMDHPCYDTGRDELGNQIFNPDQHETECYSYEYSYNHFISGQWRNDFADIPDQNKIWQFSNMCNSGKVPDYVTAGNEKLMPTRSIYNDVLKNVVQVCFNSDGFFDPSRKLNDCYPILPSFTFGKNYHDCVVTVDLGKGFIAQGCNAPEGWIQVDNSNKYEKSFISNTPYNVIAKEWENAPVVSEDLSLFYGLNILSYGLLQNNEKFEVLWDSNCVVANVYLANEDDSLELIESVSKYMPACWVQNKDNPNIYSKAFAPGIEKSKVAADWDNTALSMLNTHEEFYGQLLYDDGILEDGYTFNTRWFPWLDELSWDDLYNNSVDLSIDGKNSEYYKQYYLYLKKDEIWWSQSHGYFEEKGYNYCSAVSSDDVLHCNQQYKCTFVSDTAQNPNPNNYIFLRVMGILHDYTDFEDIDNRAGLTFQFLHALPESQVYSYESTSGGYEGWAEECHIYKYLNSSDGFIKHAPFINTQNIKETSKKVTLNEWGYDTKTKSGSKFFLPTYSEIHSVDNKYIQDGLPSPAHETGRDINGNQLFNIDPNCYSAGYTYEWPWYFGISGSESTSEQYKNSVLKYIICRNDGTIAEWPADKASWIINERYFESTYGKASYISYDGGVIKEFFPDNDPCAVVPCFCFGNTSDEHYITLDFGDNTFFDDAVSIPSGWSSVSGKENAFVAKRNGTRGYQPIIDEWKDANKHLINFDPSYYFDGFDIEGKRFIADTTLTANWSKGNKISVSLGDGQIVSGNEPCGWLYDVSENVYCKAYPYGYKFDDIYSEWYDGKTPKIFKENYDFAYFKHNKTGDFVYEDTYLEAKLYIWIDFLTLDELNEASYDISLNGEDSIYYDQFMYYATDYDPDNEGQDKHIWWSHSKGWFRQNNYNYASKITSDDVKNCDQIYKNNFKVQGKSGMVDAPLEDQFIFLRVVGVNHDISAGQSGNKRCGLTFMPIHVIKQGYSIAEFSGSWWGSDPKQGHTLKDTLEKTIYPQLCSEFKNKIVSTQKYSSVNREANVNISTTNDNLFIPSYSEMMNRHGEPDQEIKLSHSWYGNGYNEDGEVVFDPDNPQTEGYLYEWFKAHDIRGDNFGNVLLSSMFLPNDGTLELPDRTATLFSTQLWTRSVYLIPPAKSPAPATYTDEQRMGAYDCIGPYGHLDDTSQSYIIYEQSTQIAFPNLIGVLPMFCLGQTAQKCQLYLDIKDCSTFKNPPRSWTAVREGGKVVGYKRTVNFGDDIETYVSELSKCVYTKDNNDFVKLEYPEGAVIRDTQLKPKFIPSLDCMSLEDLAKASDDIAKYGHSSQYYEQFNYYMEEDKIWCSQSNNALAGYTPGMPLTSRDVALCNQNYRCNFVPEDPGSPNNFIFLRVIGINHDYASNKDYRENYGDRCGITFQTIHAIPYASKYSDDYKNWWGSENTIRTKLQKDSGEIYSGFNENFKVLFSPMDKYTQRSGVTRSDIDVTSDVLSIPSYSELYRYNPAYTAPWYGNGLDDYGNQAFDPKKPTTEGYCYEWYYNKAVDGSKPYNNNDATEYLSMLNDGSYVEEAPNTSISNNLITSLWQRSMHYVPGEHYPSDEGYMIINKSGSINKFVYPSVNCVVAPCFALTMMNQENLDSNNDSTANNETRYDSFYAGINKMVDIYATNGKLRNILGMFIYR